MTREEARALFSDYLEGMLDFSSRDRLQEYLASNPEAAAELIQFERTLALLHRLPPREPVLDLWREFAPRLAEYRAERRRHPFTRLGDRWAVLLHGISEGLIVWTHALAGRTHARFERYLLHDPLGRSRQGE